MLLDGFRGSTWVLAIRVGYGFIPVFMQFQAGSMRKFAGLIPVQQAYLFGLGTESPHIRPVTNWFGTVRAKPSQFNICRLHRDSLWQ